jgi:5-formyltetrahydrofolate cyclo-ligase
MRSAGRIVASGAVRRFVALERDREYRTSGRTPPGRAPHGAIAGRSVRYHRPMPAGTRPPHADAPLLAAKKAMRARMLAARDALDPAARAAAARAIASRIAALPSFDGAVTVLATLPFGSEWNMRPLVQAALDRGKTVVLPRVDPAARSLVLHRIADLDADVVPGFGGIPEPAPRMPVVPPRAIDCVLVPGVAFDAAGRRLGYGGGYYDRLLPLLRHGVPRIGGAFELQIVDEVPAGAHDVAVDFVVTPGRTLAARR